MTPSRNSTIPNIIHNININLNAEDSAAAPSADHGENGAALEAAQPPASLTPPASISPLRYDKIPVVGCALPISHYFDSKLNKTILNTTPPSLDQMHDPYPSEPHWDPEHPHWNGDHSICWHELWSWSCVPRPRGTWTCAPRTANNNDPSNDNNNQSLSDNIEHECVSDNYPESNPDHDDPEDGEPVDYPDKQYDSDLQLSEPDDYYDNDYDYNKDYE
jgi:hypothetical protein